MGCIKEYLPEEFFGVGISYKNSDADTRGQFSISFKQYENIVKLAPCFGVGEMFVLSTCNRTEIYGFAKDSSVFINLLHSQATGDLDLLKKTAYVKNGIEAIRHLYYVGCGLDSQILGDYEIVSQLKHAVNFSRDNRFMGSFLERLISSVLQSSKKVKTFTALSSGSVSVSFSAARYIKEKTRLTSTSKILVLGAGKIGRNTCKNLLGYFPSENITIMNRSLEKAMNVAKELDINYVPSEFLSSQIDAADVILVATSSTEPVILKSHLLNAGKKVILDLSIPCNVEAGVIDLPDVEVIYVDQVSKLKDDNLKKRIAEVPKAKRIIESQINEFMEWVDKRNQMSHLLSGKAESEISFSGVFS